MSGSLRAALVIAAAASLLAAACSRARIDKLLSALEQGEIERARGIVSDLPRCAEVDEGARLRCFTALTVAFGAKDGFVLDPSPSNASAAAAATLLFRDHAGYVLPSPKLWAAVIERSNVRGASILRLATARAMLDVKPLVTAPPTDDEAMRALLRAVAGSVPGACVTYRLLAEGKDPRTLAPELRPEHSPCVQGDLARPGAAGASFGAGLPRAVAGAQSAWRATLASLKAGASKFPDPKHAQLARDIAELEAATLVAPRADDAPKAALDFVHGHIDAGIIVARDAGRR